MISLCRAEGWAAAFGSVGMQCFAPASWQPSDKSLYCVSLLSQERTPTFFSSPPLCRWVHILDHFISGYKQDFVQQGLAVPNGDRRNKQR